MSLFSFEREPIFWLSQLIYWVSLYLYPSREPSLIALVVKCLPVASLAFSMYIEDEPQNEADDGKVNSEL